VNRNPQPQIVRLTRFPHVQMQQLPCEGKLKYQVQNSGGFHMTSLCSFLRDPPKGRSRSTHKLSQ